HRCGWRSRAGAGAVTRTAMRERRRRDRAARRRLPSCSSWSASVSRYSCTNIGCMVAPLPRLVALLLDQSVSCGQKYVLLEQTPGARVFIGLGQDGGMDSEDLRLAVYRAFAGTGRAPEPGELAGQFGTDVREVAAGLDELAGSGRLGAGLPRCGPALGFLLDGIARCLAG